MFLGVLIHKEDQTQMKNVHSPGHIIFPKLYQWALIKVMSK